MIDLNAYIERILAHFELRNDLEEFDKIRDEIEKSVVFKGTNLWILAFAIVIASVGLNMNSTAAIIGAMLISPLMGPINGVGFSIATYNLSLLSRALRNLSFAILSGLTASTIYFILSPVSSAHSELLARTTPTFYDVLIALFGGMAGIVAISTRLKGNVIPGVAIATALMPPLCTAGYGLATLQAKFFFGALYLFTINTVFIALAALLVSKMLKFPLYDIVDKSKIKRINQVTYAVIVLTFIPSLYFAFQLVTKEKFIQKAERFVENVTYLDGAYLLRHNVEPSSKSINLVYGGRTLSEEEKKLIQEKTHLFDIEAKVEVKQGFGMDDSGLKNLSEMARDLENLRISVIKKQQTIDSLNNRYQMGNELIDELQVLFPEIKGIAVSPQVLFYRNKQTKELTMVIIDTKEKRLTDETKNTLHNYLKSRTKTENIKIITLENED
ncbi:MAG: hypothetical protein PWR20_672 [Bacteroidales bacterium]|jgi:uncharacterized hydrophobic protein (TIGR00271 family)|nr:hypothetical protein [Bacteroidales bacterium]MDN5328783.1 hypothetical protein [Bacteroidales bacterium]